MGYWGDVHRRARRETLELVKLEHPGRAAFTLGLVVVPALIIWWAAADSTAWLRALATVGAMAICGALGYGVKMLTIPPAMAAEAEDERKKLVATLASFDGPEEDVGLHEAVAYVLHRGWGRSLWDGNGDLEDCGGAVREIRARAGRGRIHIWGRTGNPALHKVVPAEFWQEVGIDFLSVVSGEAQPVRSEKNARLDPPRWHDLKANKAEFEREWPRTAC